MDQARFDKKIQSILAVQAHHNGQIKGLIRAAQLQQNSLKRLEARQAAASAKREKEFEKMRRQRLESEKKLDARIGELVSAIGELIRRSPTLN